MNTMLLEEKIKSRVPDFQIKFKDEDNFMKFIGKIMFFNKNFMTRYINTLGKDVYFPNRKKFEDNRNYYFDTLAHEYVHILDYVLHPVSFIKKYIFPQVLAFPAILFVAFSPILVTLMAFSIISPLFLLSLLSAVFLIPFPSSGRTEIEIRGYGMSACVRKWRGEDTDVKSYLNYFSGPDYYYMCKDENYVSKELEKFLKTDDCLNDENLAYKDVYELINK